MNAQRLTELIYLSREDLSRQDFRRAKNRLNSVLRNQPFFRPALELIGHIYYAQGDYRNAVMYWSQADCWNGEMSNACTRVFKSTAHLLVHEHLDAARYYLYAFAGCRPPADTQKQLSKLQSAYYHLTDKKSRLAGVAGAPIAGVCLMILAGTTAAFLGANWPLFLFIGVLSVITTFIVTGLNAWAYVRASRRFNTSMAACLTKDQTDQGRRLC